MLERKEPLQQNTLLILDINPRASRLIVSINMILFIICFCGNGKNLLRCAKTAKFKKATKVTNLNFFLVVVVFFFLLEKCAYLIISFLFLLCFVLFLF